MSKSDRNVCDVNGDNGIDDDLVTGVAEAIRNASKYGLQAEVIAFAMQYVRDNPEWSYADCLSLAFADWIK